MPLVSGSRYGESLQLGYLILPVFLAIDSTESEVDDGDGCGVGSAEGCPTIPSFVSSSPLLLFSSLVLVSFPESTLSSHLKKKSQKNVYYLLVMFE